MVHCEGRLHRVLMIDIDWMIFNEQYLILVGWNLMSIRDYRCASFSSLMIEVDWMMFNAQYFILVEFYVMSNLIKKVRNYLCYRSLQPNRVYKSRELVPTYKTSDGCLETFTSVVLHILKVNYFDHYTISIKIKINDNIINYGWTF